MIELSEHFIRKSMELHAFSGGVITITLEDANKIYASVIDTKDKEIKLELRNNTSSKDLNKKNVTFMFGYKKKLITFETSILDVADNIITINEIKNYKFDEFRKDDRINLLHLESDISINFESNDHIPKKFTSSHMLDMSDNAITLFLDRTQGLLLPGELIKNLCILYDGKVILNSEATIIRIDPNRNLNDGEKHYLVVLKIKSVNIQKNQTDKNERDIDRKSFIDNEAAFVELKHPFFPSMQVIAQLIDISLSGIGFMLDILPFPICEGMIFKGVELQLPKKRRHILDIKVSNFRSDSMTDGSVKLVGAEILKSSIHFVKDINQITTNTSNNIYDANLLDHDTLWEFFFETGFIYSGKRKQIQKYSKELYKTYNNLLNTNNSILKKILFKEENKIKGHISAIRFFDNSWIVQHLNTLKGSGATKIGKEVIKAMIDFFLDSKSNYMHNIDFIVFNFRPDNIYPATLFGAISNIINDTNICGFHDFDFYTQKESLQANSDYKKCDIREATTQDVSDLEKLLIIQKNYKEIRIESLTQSTLLTMEISKLYEELSLYRYRKCFIATSEDIKIYAVCNFSSPGLNLSELTNSVKLYTTSKINEDNIYILDALMEYIHIEYKKTDMDNFVLLLKKEQTAPTSFEMLKQYRYFYINSSYVVKFKEIADEVFDNFKKHIIEYKKNFS